MIDRTRFPDVLGFAAIRETLTKEPFDDELVGMANFIAQNFMMNISLGIMPGHKSPGAIIMAAAMGAMKCTREEFLTLAGIAYDAQALLWEQCEAMEEREAAEARGQKIQ